jgi:hypothetical protein
MPRRESVLAPTGAQFSTTRAGKTLGQAAPQSPAQNAAPRPTRSRVDTLLPAQKEAARSWGVVC